MSVTSVHFTQRSEANRATSQRTISFLNKRNINKLPPVLTMASVPSYMVKKHSESYVTYSFTTGLLTV